MTNESTIEDGFGGSWSSQCPRCGLNTMSVVRPGKVQCESGACFLYGSIEDAINTLDLERTLSVFNDHE